MVDISRRFWSQIGGPPAERVWKQALADFKAFDLDEFRDDVTAHATEADAHTLEHHHRPGP